MYEVDIGQVRSRQLRDKYQNIPAGEYIFFYGKGNGNQELGTGFLNIGESYHQLRWWSLLVIGCHAYY
jgi:hypothetical protein